jgi:hypothetical protein
VNLKSDARLDAKVTLQQPLGPVSAALEALAKSSGVSLAAGKDEEDWLSRELPVCVLLKDTPLRDAMERLAELTGFHWSVSGEGDQRAYLLWQDLQARQRQEEERVKLLEERERKRITDCVKDLETLGAYAKLSPKQAQELESKDPMGYMMATQPGFTSLTRILGSLSPEQRLKVTTAEGLRLPISRMPPALKEEVVSCLTGFVQLYGRMMPRSHASSADEGAGDAPGEGPGGELDLTADALKPEAILRELSGAVVSIQAGSRLMDGMDEDEGPEGMRMVAGSFNIVGAGGSSGFPGFPIFAPGSPVAGAIAKMFTAMQEGAPEANMNVIMDNEARKLVENAFGQMPPPPGDPELLRKVALKFPPEKPATPETGADENVSAQQVLTALHEATGSSILAEVLPSSAGAGGGMPVAAGLKQEAPLYQVLARIRMLYGLRSERKGGLLAFSDTRSPIKRAWLVPRKLIARWRQKYESPAGMSVGDLLQMSELTPDQLNHGFEGAELGYTASLVAGQYTALRFLASLTAPQMAGLRNGQPLPIRALSPDQLALVTQALSDDPDPALGPMPVPVRAGTQAPPRPIQGALKLREAATSPDKGKPLFERVSLDLVLVEPTPVSQEEERSLSVQAPSKHQDEPDEKEAEAAMKAAESGQSKNPEDVGEGDLSGTEGPSKATDGDPSDGSTKPGKAPDTPK